MKFFDFAAFQKIKKMLSHDNILFHMLFGAFHDTTCSSYDINTVIEADDVDPSQALAQTVQTDNLIIFSVN